MEDIDDGAYFQLDTQINLGDSVYLEGLGNFNLSRTYDSTDTYFPGLTYEYKSVIDISKIENKSERLEFELKDIDTNKVQHYTLNLEFKGSIKQVHIVDSKGTEIGISINGKTELGTSFKADKIEEDNKTYIEMRNMFSTSEDSLFIYAYDISLVQGSYEGDLLITFDVGKQFNGKVVNILHKKQDGSSENFKDTVSDGKVTISVSELSPFMIAIEDRISNNSNNNTQTQEPSENTSNKGTLDNTPKTGVTNMIYFVLPIAVLAATGIIVLKKRETK